jgi:hypothetical protein
VATKGAEPRNRRVEVSFQGSGMPADAPLLNPPVHGNQEGSQPPLDLHPRPDLPLPRLAPLGATPTLSTPKSGQRVDPTRPTTQPRPGETTSTSPAGGGVLLKAVIEYPAIKSWIEQTKNQKLHELGDKTTPAEKGVLGVTVLSMATMTAIGISTEPAARRTALDLLDGQEIDVPGVPGLKVRALTKGGSLGGGLQLDLTRIIPGLK